MRGTGEGMSAGELGFRALLRAAVDWTLLLAALTVALNYIARALEGVARAYPLDIAKYMAELTVVMVNPMAHLAQLDAISGALRAAGLGISPGGLELLLIAMDLSLLATFTLTLLSGVSLLVGALRIQGHGLRPAALAGSSISLAGSALALAGFVLLLMADVTPVVDRGMAVSVGPSTAYLTVPLPWPIALGVLLWVVGVAALGAALLPHFAIGRDVSGTASAALLVASAAVIEVPLAAFALMAVASAVMVLTHRGVAP